MQALARFTAILGLALLLGACGGSGGSAGGNRATDGETSTPPATQPTPVAEHPGTIPPLACDGSDRACPEGYRCVADPSASCDPATGMACAGICVLGEPLPGCGGSGTVSNADRASGSTCLAERRMLETLDHGRPMTPFLSFGDRVRIEMFDAEGRSIFGAIDQRVAKA